MKFHVIDPPARGGTECSGGCLGIPGDYEFMDPALVRLLEVRVGPLLLRLGGRASAS